MICIKLINHKVTFLRWVLPKKFPLEKKKQDIQAISRSKIKINSSKLHTFLFLSCSVEQVFSFGPEEIFLDHFSSGDAESEASSEAREICSFSTPSSRYTHMHVSHIHNTHRAAGRHLKQSSLLYLLYNHHGTQQINCTNQLIENINSLKISMLWLLNTGIDTRQPLVTDCVTDYVQLWQRKRILKHLSWGRERESSIICALC